MKIAVVTAVYGGVDLIRPPKQQESHHDVSFHLFGAKSDSWQCHDPAFGAHVPNIYKARCVKTCPHMFMPKEYDAFIWVDGYMEVFGKDFVQVLADLLGESQVGFYLCSSNKNLAQHVSCLCGLPLFKTLGLHEQVKSYLDQGYKDTILYETGVHVRRNAIGINAMCNEWMSNLFMWCYRDQFALPFLLWKHQISPVILGPSVWSSENHKHHGHLPAYAAVRHNNTDGSDRWTPPDGGDPAVSSG